MKSRLAVLGAFISAFSCGGCKIAPGYTAQHVEVELRYEAAASTAVYSKAKSASEYELARYEGTARVTMTQAERWGLAASVAGESSRAVAQPLCRQAVRLTRSGQGAKLAFEGGETCQLRFVVGSWQDYLEGRRVVMKLEEAAWDLWAVSIHAAFLKLVEEYGGKIQRSIKERVTLTYVEDPDILVHEQPLIQADQRQLMVFFERLKVTNQFEVVEWLPGSRLGVIARAGIELVAYLGLAALEQACDRWRSAP